MEGHGVGFHIGPALPSSFGGPTEQTLPIAGASRAVHGEMKVDAQETRKPDLLRSGNQGTLDPANANNFSGDYHG